MDGGCGGRIHMCPVEWEEFVLPGDSGGRGRVGHEISVVAVATEIVVAVPRVKKKSFVRIEYFFRCADRNAWRRILHIHINT